MGKLTVDSNRVSKVMDAIEESTSDLYNIKSFMDKHNIPYEVKGNELVTKCFEHTDSHPSMRVNILKNNYHCFSCNAKGKFINFVKGYNNYIGNTISFARIVNTLLNEDLELQGSLGFKSIYVSKKEDFDVIMDNLNYFNDLNCVSTNFEPKNSLQVVNKLNRTKILTVEDKKRLIYYIQEGIEPSDMYRLLTNENLAKATTVSSIIGDL